MYDNEEDEDDDKKQLWRDDNKEIDEFFSTYTPALNNAVSSLSSNISANWVIPGKEGVASTEAIFFLSALFCLVGAVGFIGNILIVVVIARDKKMRHSVTNQFIVNVAIADFLSTVFAVPEIVQFMMNRGWLLGLTLCKFNRFILVCSLYASILTLMAVSIERYIAIVHPIKTHIICSRRRTLTTIALTWPIAAIFGSPTVFFNAVVSPSPGEQFCRIVFPGGHMIGNAVYKSAESVIFFFIPVLLQLSLYAVVGRRLFAGVKALRASGMPGSTHAPLGYQSGAIDGPTTSNNNVHRTIPMILIVDHTETETHSSGANSVVGRDRTDSSPRQSFAMATGDSTADLNLLDDSNSYSFDIVDDESNSRRSSNAKEQNAHFTNLKTDRFANKKEANGCTVAKQASARITTSLTHPMVSPCGGGRTSEAIRARQGVVKMLVACVIVYVISYAPSLIPTFYNMTSSTPFRSNWTFHVTVIILTYINSAANPLLYAIFSQNFRHQFARLLCPKRRGDGDGTSPSRRRQGVGGATSVWTDARHLEKRKSSAMEISRLLAAEAKMRCGGSQVPECSQQSIESFSTV